MVARPSNEAKYQAMTQTTCEMIWIQSLLCKMGVASSESMVMYYDNQAAMYIANNPVFYERMKHIAVDCQFIRDMVMAKQIVISYVTYELN